MKHRLQGAHGGEEGPGGFGLYVHWPFCESKCPYCDFNSHVGGRADPALWMEAYGHEIARIARETGPRRLTSMFFGGGTPSLMAPEVVERVIAAARRHWAFANSIEITMEANPGSADAARFAAYRAAGVNRMSIGIQALRDDDLKALGRRHTVREARSALDLALSLFDRVSFDLIYARQDQRPDEWAAELTEALTLGTTHLSLYQLTIEPGTAFAARRATGGLRGLPNENLSAEMYEVTQDLCAAAGLSRYEVSNHAAPGAECRHNLIYWTAGDWAGVGPGAHGRLTIGDQRFATEAAPKPDEWLDRTGRGSGECLRLPLTAVDQTREYLLSGLRLTEGICLGQVRRLLGGPVSLAPLKDLEDWGLLHPMVDARDRVRPTPRGHAVLDSVIRYLDEAWIG